MAASRPTPAAPAGQPERGGGAAAVADATAETRTHREALAEFRKQLAVRHPKLGIETGLMALDGTLERIL